MCTGPRGIAAYQFDKLHCRALSTPSLIHHVSHPVADMVRRAREGCVHMSKRAATDIHTHTQSNSARPKTHQRRRGKR